MPASRPLSASSLIPALSGAQHARLLSIDTPLGADVLLADSFSGQEALSELFRFDVDCLSASAHLPLKALIGEHATLRLLLADGNTRAFHGMVAETRQLGADGGFASYRVTLVPWMHSLTLRRDSYVFQDKSVLDILEEIFRDYPNACYRFAVQTALPARSLTMQYRESDYAFVTRLLAEEGLGFFFEHIDDADGARHRLVVFDDNAVLATCSQPAIRFHRADAAETEDSITFWSQQRRIDANAVALSSWDYKTLAATAADDSLPTGDAPRLEVYEGSGAYRYTDRDESARIARARTESLQLAQQRVHGESAARQLAHGTWFTLGEHPDADGDYIVLSVTHHAASNLHGGTRTPDAERGSYRNQFTCVARATPIRPPYWFPKPLAPGPQIALVVGVSGEEITTERDHRIKIQFPWQRGTRAASGQHMHPAGCNAPGDERAGTWVRVAEAAAGANWGAAFVPRIGQEVCVDFIAGDIDRPVVTGQFYNGADTPPFHGADNHPGALSGIRTREYAGSGYNQWVIDDTPGQLRQSLSSSYAASQLDLGYLIHQNGNVRGGYRGSGFELATDAWSTLRAKRGIFISTSQRARASSTQLDSSEAQQKLQSACELAASLSQAAGQHQALPLSTPDGLHQLDQTLNGKQTADGQQAPAFEQPVALFDSAAGISLATPTSSVLYAGQDLTLTASTAMRLSAGQAASLVAARTVSLFTHSGGAKVIAAKEPVSVRAHTGPMDVLADQAITVTSSNGQVRLQAKQEILLAAGGGYIRLNGGDIDIHCPASLSVKGVTHGFLRAGSGAANIAALPRSVASLEEVETEIEVIHYDMNGKFPKGDPLQMNAPDNTEKKANTDGSGKARFIVKKDHELSVHQTKRRTS